MLWIIGESMEGQVLAGLHTHVAIQRINNVGSQSTLDGQESAFQCTFGSECFDRWARMAEPSDDASGSSAVLEAANVAWYTSRTHSE